MAKKTIKEKADDIVNSAIENEEEKKLEAPKIQAPKIQSVPGAVTLGGSSAVQGSTQSTQAQQTESDQTQQVEFDGDKYKQIVDSEEGKKFLNDIPSQYEDWLREKGYKQDDGNNSEKITNLMADGMSFADAVKQIELESSLKEKQRVERTTKSKKTMANLMEAFRLAVDIAGAKSGANVYDRGDLNRKVIDAANKEKDKAFDKYQKAIDEFNARMDALKRDDIAARRERANMLARVAFTNKGKSSSDSIGVSQSDTEQQTVSKHQNVVPRINSGRGNSYGGYGGGENPPVMLTAKKGVFNKDPKTGKETFKQTGQTITYTINPSHWDYVKNNIAAHMLGNQNVINAIKRDHPELGGSQEDKGEFINQILSGTTLKSSAGIGSTDYTQLRDMLIKKYYMLSKDARDYLDAYTQNNPNWKTVNSNNLEETDNREVIDW